jgi:hypothetical protein
MTSGDYSDPPAGFYPSFLIAAAVSIYVITQGLQPDSESIELVYVIYSWLVGFLTFTASIIGYTLLTRDRDASGNYGGGR